MDQSAPRHAVVRETPPSRSLQPESLQRRFWCRYTVPCPLTGDSARGPARSALCPYISMSEGGTWL